MATNTNAFRTLSTSAVLRMVTATNRSEADVRRASLHFTEVDARADFERALWIYARTALDGVKGKDVAAEVNLSTGRVSQIRAPFVAMLDAGIPFPEVDTVKVWADTVAHLSRVYKSSAAGRNSIAEAVETASALDDVASKIATFTALNPLKVTRDARPNDNLAATESDPAPETTANTSPATSTPEERPATFVEMLANLVSLADTAPIADTAYAMDLVDELSNKIAARTEMVSETVEA